MSKIALPIAELKPALTGFGKIIAKRTTLPVLNHIKIERTTDGWRFVAGVVAYYLVRDTLIYVVLPLILVRKA